MTNTSLSRANDRLVHTVIFLALLLLSTVRFQTVGDVSPAGIANVLAMVGGAGFVVSMVRLISVGGDLLNSVVKNAVAPDAADWAESVLYIVFAAAFVRDYLSPPAVSHYWPEIVSLLQTLTGAAAFVLLFLAIVKLPPVRTRLDGISTPEVVS